MPNVTFTRNLRRFFPSLVDGPLPGATVRQVLDEAEARWPGLGAYVVDDRGALRKHVNIFVNGEMVADRQALSDAVSDRSDIHVIQALSGG